MEVKSIMELIMSSVLTAIINLLVFSSIPLIWWFADTEKKKGSLSG